MSLELLIAALISVEMHPCEVVEVSEDVVEDACLEL